MINEEEKFSIYLGYLMHGSKVNFIFNLFNFIVLLSLLSCTQSALKKYETYLEPKIGLVLKKELDRALGSPVQCRMLASFERCEYRTAYGRNEPVPGVLRPSQHFRPDLSPFDYFDVLYLYYDIHGILREWKPIHLN